MKQCIKITTLLVALFSTALLSNIATAALPKALLVKAELVNSAQLLATAHNSLEITLTPLNINYDALIMNSNIAKKKQMANKNKSITLSKTNLIAE